MENAGVEVDSWPSAFSPSGRRSSWLDRRALEWASDRPLHQRAGRRSGASRVSGASSGGDSPDGEPKGPGGYGGGYWDLLRDDSPLSPLLSKLVGAIGDEAGDSTAAGDPRRASQRHSRCYLSYLSASCLSASLARGLRKTIVDKKLHFRDHDAPTAKEATVGFSKCGGDADQKAALLDAPTITVAIAIPEGVLLPLAISAVHALNWPLVSEEDAVVETAAFSAVLAPVDPSDAPRRLAQMLRTCRPALILTAADADRDRLARAGWGDAVIDVRDMLLLKDTTIDEHHRKLLELSRTLGSTRGCGGDDDDGSSVPWHEWILRCEVAMYGGDVDVVDAASSSTANRVSHVVFTSGTTGVPKGCVSSIRSLLCYLHAKNATHQVTSRSKVLLASSISFDPCLGDILATLTARATLVVPRRCGLLEALLSILQDFEVSHCLCTPTLWGSVMASAIPNPNSAPSSSFGPTHPGPHLVPRLRVLALGGEPIPPPLIHAWARPPLSASSACAAAVSSKPAVPTEAADAGPRLLATYGVTEACVYQTLGEVFRGQGDKGAAASGHSVGRAFAGVGVRICDETVRDRLLEALPNDNGVRVGEIVLYGNQVDEYHSYLHQPGLSKVFLRDECGRFCYRTGDRGYVEASDVFLCGRIGGEEGMIKIAGIRIEVGELEASLVDEMTEYPVVVDCLVSVAKASIHSGISAQAKDVIAYVVLSAACLEEMSVLLEIPACGVLIPPSLPLLSLLRERCRLKSRIVPASFIIIPRIPLSPTGKRNRNAVPNIELAVPFVALAEIGFSRPSIPLCEYSETGALLSRILVENLNLLPVQETLLTSSAAYATAGGDSLSATRIVRILYSHHFGVQDSRFLGGEYGQLEEPFTARGLLSAESLGQYVDWLDSKGFRGGGAGAKPADNNQTTLRLDTCASDNAGNVSSPLYDSLFQSIALGHSAVAVGLLEVGADPNLEAPTSRLSKVSGRKSRIVAFRTSPLHMACFRGDSALVRQLLERKARYNSPDPSGMFPIHLAAAGGGNRRGRSALSEDLERLECMKHLLQAGAPLLMKDGSKQTVLHCSARSGHCALLTFLMREFQLCAESDARKSDSFNWRDNWARTPVHWAILNGNVEALEILLSMGCSARPRKPKVIAGSSVANESPAEICERIYGSSDLGRKISSLLNARQDP